MDLEEIYRSYRRSYAKDLLAKPEECLFGLLDKPQNYSKIVFAWTNSDICKTL